MMSNVIKMEARKHKTEDQKDEIADTMLHQIIDIVDSFHYFESKEDEEDNSTDCRLGLRAMITELLKNIPLEKVENISEFFTKELEYVNRLKKKYKEK